MRVVTLNLNGLRAAQRKGLVAWLTAVKPDIVCCQEVRAYETDLDEAIRNPAGLRGYFVVAEKPGYSGVAIFCRKKPLRVDKKIGHKILDTEGRWLRLDFARCSVFSLYMPSASSGDARQQIKYEIMDAVYEKLAALSKKAKREGRELLLCSDINIAHTEKDIKNWRGNMKNSGFLPDERAWLSRLFESGWHDVFRRLNDEDGQYTWWSNRGRAWQNNVGWRIDYQIATAQLAGRAYHADIYKTERFSDHAPLVIDYRFAL
ncbi:MAG: exodeoxyribonuclease III [Candidatus Zeuxoniibacter abyssi]|nr:MAG: exodeoxyribonuclease III [Candidatus Persebacteraceae bacterium AB1(2)]